ncbi:uncharacterized protein LOC127254808 [Andrographis paniculata]|uniref:uncharacterized protein LOC127254808 n=1 Tax=Andrographis paniculata TaxID=175694 RepID=UPI0021E8D714|nr:uncharacterized protein LOC127254808 [Andrographis paniculata]XP_051136058.1 uncharacterized protein LOC127254808 [Andrographis paniculata]XP_051136059.1 uncharacterized protein LOC127254808 [Andrographis paniculata]
MEIHRRPPSLGGSGPSGFPRCSAPGLEDLEADIQLLCPNTMFYDNPYTIYHNQVLAILKLAAEEFGRFKDHEEKDKVKVKDMEKDKEVELQLLQAVQKRSLKLKGKNLANDGSETEDNQGTSSGDSNLRKVPTLSKQQPQLSFSQPSAYNWNGEFPASVVKTEVKQGWKNINLVPSYQEASKILWVMQEV